MTKRSRWSRLRDWRYHPGDLPRWIFRAGAVGLQLLAMGCLLYFLLRWEVYFCERYNRPGKFFADPVWRVPLLVCLLFVWALYLLKGIWEALCQPPARALRRHLGASLGILVFLPLLWTMEYPVAWNIPARWLHRDWLQTEGFCLSVSFAAVLLTAFWSQPVFRRLAGWFGWQEDGSPAALTAPATRSLPRRLWGFAFSKAGLALLVLALVGALIVWQEERVVWMILRCFLYPKRWQPGEVW